VSKVEETAVQTNELLVGASLSVFKRIAHAIAVFKQ
jgi:hypothetical protein